MGHRQELTRVMVKSISITKGSSKEATKNSSEKKSSTIKATKA